jgi:hypothetical protein
VPISEPWSFPIGTWDCSNFISFEYSIIGMYKKYIYICGMRIINYLYIYIYKIRIHTHTYIV